VLFCSSPSISNITSDVLAIEYRVFLLSLVMCCLVDYRVFLSSLVRQEVDELPRALTSTFSLQQTSSATNYHSLPITSLLRAIVDDLRSIGKHGMLRHHHHHHRLLSRRQRFEKNANVGLNTIQYSKLMEDEQNN